MDRPRRENAGSRSSSRSKSPGASTRPTRGSARKARAPSPAPSEAVSISPEQRRPDLAFALSPDAPSPNGLDVEALLELLPATPPTAPPTAPKPAPPTRTASKPKKLQILNLLKAPIDELHNLKAMDAKLALEVIEMPDYKQLIQLIINKKSADDKGKGTIAQLQKFLKERELRLEQALTHLQVEKARAKHAAQQAHIAADKEALRVCLHPLTLCFAR